MTSVPFLDLAAAHADQAPELEEAFRRVVRSGRYIRGVAVERFESEFAAFCGAAGACGVGNGLDAITLALRALGVGPGDEVLVSAHTSVATWLGVTHTGARPVPVEPRWDTMLIDPPRAADAVGPRTAAILAVHLYGLPADMDALGALAHRHGLALVEDASQAHGARWRGRPVGSLGDVAAFSLYPTKNLGAIGDAGIVVSGDEALLGRVRMLASYGERRQHYSELRGANSRLDELQAALLSVKLAGLEGANAVRRARAEQYLRALSGCPGLELPRSGAGALPAWHQFVVRCGRDRDAVRAELAGRGIETLIHYPTPPHRTPAYAADYPESLPVTERLAASVLSLPMSPQLGEEACREVAEAVAAVAAAKSTVPAAQPCI